MTDNTTTEAAEAIETADAAESDHAESHFPETSQLRRDLDGPAEPRGFRIEGTELPAKSQRQGDGMIGHLLRAVVGHIADGDAKIRRRGHVH